MTRRVVITGVGAVTPLGVGARTLHQRWTAGACGIDDGEGACTCPGFDKFGACKHQAAVVVAANLLDGTGRGYVRDRLARLRDGLALESKDALIERIVELAKRDPKVLAGLEG